jgi:hypothetical protein
MSVELAVAAEEELLDDIDMLVSDGLDAAEDALA